MKYYRWRKLSPRIDLFVKWFIINRNHTIVLWLKIARFNLPRNISRFSYLIWSWNGVKLTLSIHLCIHKWIVYLNVKFYRISFIAFHWKIPFASLLALDDRVSFELDVFKIFDSFFFLPAFSFNDFPLNSLFHIFIDFQRPNITWQHNACYCSFNLF